MSGTSRRFPALGALLVAAGLIVSACSAEPSDSPDAETGAGEAGTLTVYSGRTENLIGPILDDFTEETGITAKVRYGQSADLALQIDTEGDRSPADVFISQSPGAVGHLADQDRLSPLPKKTLSRVQKQFRADSGEWVGMSGRVRVLVYNTDEVDPKDLPDSVFDLTGEDYTGQVGIAPANGSFQDFVTAMRLKHGEDRARKWLDDMAANESPTYANNTSIVEAVGRGEVPMGLVNHYYNERAKAEDAATPSENYFFPDGDIGSLLIDTGVGVLGTSDHEAEADELVAFLLGDSAQEFFSTQTFEYPLAEGVPAPEGVPALDSLDYATVDVDELGGGLARTLEMIQASGLSSS